MGAWGTARLLPELSNFYCLPGRAGGSPWVTSEHHVKHAILGQLLEPIYERVIPVPLAHV